MASRGERDIVAADIEWRDGSGDGIRYARFRMDETDASSPTVILSKFAPGVIVGAHTHDSNYLEYIVAGEQSIGKRVFGAGDVRIVRAGTGYGPIKVGAEGCTVMIVFQDGARSVAEPLPRAPGVPRRAIFG